MRTCILDAATLRQLWTVIAETPTSVLLRLSDTDLVHQIMHQLNTKQPCFVEETNHVQAYLSSRTPLIRELASARQN